mmetsp:Transcript_4270/g.14137  ORF Transcript_4270/g.14137 Transcript_4270/m.14137 type:complete len:327 (+) Transcript_4270:912-1892(+)
MKLGGMRRTLLCAGSARVLSAAVPSSTTKTLGWYGLGTMGTSIAGYMHKYSLEKYGRPALVASRTASKAEALSGEIGAEYRADFASLAAECDVIGLCLSTTADVEEVLSSAPLRRGTLIVDVTSGGPAATVELGERLKSKFGVRMVDAPVSGGPVGAETGSLTSMVGGSDDDFAEAVDLIDAWSSKIVKCGPLGAGNAVKAVNNVLNAAHLLLASEGVIALTKYGVDAHTALDVINSSSGMSLQTQRLPQHVLSRKFDFGFQLGLMRKDCVNAADLLKDLTPSATLIPEVTRLMLEAETQFGSNADYTKAAQYLEDLAGCPMSTGK